MLKPPLDALYIIHTYTFCYKVFYNVLQFNTKTTSVFSEVYQ